MNSMTIGIVFIDIFFLFDHAEILKPNCHKRKRMVQARNLFLQFEVALLFRAMPIYLYFLAYQKTRPHKKTWWKELKQSTHWDLIKRSCLAHQFGNERYKIINLILYDIQSIYVFA
jgi:hypothetical protein